MSAFRWFKDSPDAGDARCLCSWCGERIGLEEAPIIRVFNGAEEEARFHWACVTPAMYGSGLLPPESNPDYAPTPEGEF